VGQEPLSLADHWQDLQQRNHFALQDIQGGFKSLAVKIACHITDRHFQNRFSWARGAAKKL
jgi:hypothetical protein